MKNEQLVEKSWWIINRKWFLPTSLLISVILVTALFCSTSEGNVLHIARAYSEKSLFEKAIQKANSNYQVFQRLGKIKPIDKLAIFEGHIIYLNNNNSVELTIRVNGEKGKGKMDIIAIKNGKEWEYKTINIRVKKPIESIQILKDY